jgi:hypothetical protein
MSQKDPTRQENCVGVPMVGKSTGVLYVNNETNNRSDLVDVFVSKIVSVLEKRSGGSRGSLDISSIAFWKSYEWVSKENRTAITGVRELYYVIEHIMFDTHSVNGIAARTGDFASRRDLDTNGVLMRLDAFNMLGESVCFSLWRDQFTTAAATNLSEYFYKQYGQHLVTFFEQFKPLRFQAIVCENFLETSADESEKILFDAPVSRTEFDDPGEATDLRHREMQELGVERAQLFCSNTDGKNEAKIDGPTSEAVVEVVSRLYREVFLTHGFQTAVLCSFFREVEGAVGLPARLVFDRQQAFGEYIEQLNAFFAPSTLPQFKKLLNTFGVLISGDDPKTWLVTNGRDSIWNIINQGELQLDQWPVFRAIILEIWRPTAFVLRQRVERERAIGREQVFEEISNFSKLQSCREYVLLEDQLSDEQIDSSFNSAESIFLNFLNDLNVEEQPSNAALRKTFAPQLSDRDIT